MQLELVTHPGSLLQASCVPAQAMLGAATSMLHLLHSIVARTTAHPHRSMVPPSPAAPAPELGRSLGGPVAGSYGAGWIRQPSPSVREGTPAPVRTAAIAQARRRMFVLRRLMRPP